jgi:hypothetical protein
MSHRPLKLHGSAGGLLRATPMNPALTAMTDSLISKLQARGGAIADKSTVGASLSFESLDPMMAQRLDDSRAEMHGILINALAASNLKDAYTSRIAQESAAVEGGMLASDPAQYLRTPVASLQALQAMAVGRANVHVVGMDGSSVTRENRLSLEAYDERANANAVAYTVTWNAEASRQDEFGEIHYPSVTLTHQQIGFQMSIRLHLLQEEVRRKVNGDVSDFGRRNIMLACIDPDLIRNDQTALVPVYRATGAADDTTKYFVTPAELAPETVKIDTLNVVTSALKVGMEVDLMAVSQRDQLLSLGVLNQTDAIDPSVRLGYILVKLPACGGKVLKFNTSGMPTSDLNQIGQGNSRQMTLNFQTKKLRVTANTKAPDGSAIPELAALADKSVRLGVNLFGNMVLDQGGTLINAAPISVATVTDATQAHMGLTSGDGKAIADLFAGASVIGYKLIAWLTDSNKRLRGQLIDDQTYYQLYTVPTLPPVTSLRPTNDTDANDSERLQTLITVTRIRSCNAAVASLLSGLAAIKEAFHVNDGPADQPDTLGVARYLMSCQYEEHPMHMPTVMNSLTSEDRIADLRATLVDKIRDVAARLYMKSGMSIARDMILGSAAGKPLVILGTDPYIATYLNILGDQRLLGDLFDCKVVTTMNKNMRGKITMTFGVTSALNSGEPCPLHWGTFIWRPEVTLSMPVSRMDGSVSQEITVCPSFRHIEHTPVGALFLISGIEDVVATRIPVLTQSI